MQKYHRRKCRTTVNLRRQRRRQVDCHERFDTSSRSFNEHRRGVFDEFLIFVFPLQGIPPPVLVFLQSKDRARELFQELLYDGINVDVIHADRTQLQVIDEIFLDAFLYSQKFFFDSETTS